MVPSGGSFWLLVGAYAPRRTLLHLPMGRSKCEDWLTELKEDQTMVFQGNELWSLSH